MGSSLPVNVTINGNSAGAPCVFPFLYNGNYYAECVSLDWSVLWCSTTNNYNRDRKWGECLDYDVCLYHETLSDPWRNIGFNFTSVSGWRVNDSSLQEGWYEFSGIGGDRMAYYCLSFTIADNTVVLIDCNVNSDFVLNTCEVPTQHVDCGGELVLYYLTPINRTYITRHSSCGPSSCGQHARCGLAYGSCECEPGITIPDGFLPTGDSYGCSELILNLREECKDTFTGECAKEFLSSIQKITAEGLPQEIVERYLEKVLECMNVLENTVTDQNQLVWYGNAVLNAVEKLVSTLVMETDTTNVTNITLPTLDVIVFVVGPNASLGTTIQLTIRSALMDIDLIGISKNNNGSAAVAFMSYTNLSTLLRPSFFNSPVNTEKTMLSTVVSAILPKTTNTQLTKPVNFTLKHIARLQPKSILTCVHWKETKWVEDGCKVTHTNESHSTCSCVHLSTFALIMLPNPGQSDPLLELLNMIAVSVGLVFLSLALLTFALCKRDSRVTNTALINLCISLLLAHLLFLLTQEFLGYIRRYKMVCAAMAGVLHYLFLSAFVWMFIEAFLLFLFVKNMTKIRSKKDVLSWKYLIVIGYVIPLAVVGVSVGLFPGGYGSEKCWIQKNFTWSFLGPVCVILASNIVLFCVIIVMLKYALAGLNNQVSQFRQTRILVFKTIVQFIVLGCSWILGFFSEGSKVLEIVFLFLNSQQGTFIFLVHCVLNQKVRQQYRKYLSMVCSCCKSVTKAPAKKTSSHPHSN
ncbi:adhesion G protein-coupled receptor E3-like isoform X2 [Pygocentrus nattereri]|uniref:adhesion G protein-coupled receptor E3-like isoform X2 n=1 Tax=Pygocentrus nattereri TaxID=42514 RepID=UPI001891D2D5|nr:adhesion G protein-coupled receptor E3-like isoform X2 [Pygocentrus nattereri]